MLLYAKSLGATLTASRTPCDTAILSLADALSQDWRIGRMGTTKEAPIKGASLGLSAYTTLECTAQSARAGVAKLQDT